MSCRRASLAWTVTSSQTSAPPWIAQEVFSDPRHKAALPLLISKFLEASEGNLYAFVVASETWQRTVREDEIKEHRQRYPELCNDPSANDAMLVSVYTESHQWVWSQSMRNGTKDGELMSFCLENSVGNLVAKRPKDQ